uniref:Uncharacterized protein n=1 Tax=Rhizophora mucronata TaxID=61149 RepID=A0A2P2NVV8_RHIMU
MMEMARKLKS